MSIAQKYIVLRGDDPFAPARAYLESLNPLVGLHLRETSGTVPANYGRLSVTTLWTPGTGALGQTGKLGAADAYSFDALNSRIRIVNNATLAALTTQKWAWLVRINGLGESNLGSLFGWGAGAGGANLNYLIVQATNRLAAQINTDGTDAASIANDNQIADIIGAGIFAWIFMDYDDADALGNGRRIRLFKGINGAATQLTLGTNTAATGTVITMGANNLGVFTNDAQSLTSNGLIDEAFIDDSLWTAAQMQTIVALTGV